MHKLMVKVTLWCTDDYQKTIVSLLIYLSSPFMIQKHNNFVVKRLIDCFLHSPIINYPQQNQLINRLLHNRFTAVMQLESNFCDTCGPYPMINPSSYIHNLCLLQAHLKTHRTNKWLMHCEAKKGLYSPYRIK